MGSLEISHVRLMSLCDIIASLAEMGTVLDISMDFASGKICCDVFMAKVGKRRLRMVGRMGHNPVLRGSG